MDLVEPEGGVAPLERIDLRFACRDRFLEAITSSLIEEVERPKENGGLYAETLADAFALHLLRNYSECGRVDPPREGLSQRALRICRDYIEENLEEGVTLAELAHEVGLSRSHFVRAFRKSMGMPPHRYLTRRRIRRAQDLLTYSEQPIVDIALQCGFSSQAHFTDRFRQVTGLTPLRFRRSYS